MDLREFYRISSAFYDADYAAKGYVDDIPFYVRMAVESGGPALEMGCGSGRVLLPTARAGVSIHGLDLSAAMLAELRRSLARETDEVRRRVSLSEGDLRVARVKGRFALVTAPFRVAQHLVERQDQRAWLRNVARHLAPGGALCFDVFQPDFRHMAEAAEPRMEIDRVDPRTGYRLRRFARIKSVPELQRAEVHFRWLMEDARGRRVLESAGDFVFRWFTRGELENLLELEDFRITGYWGSFDRRPFGPGSRHQIIRAVHGKEKVHGRTGKPAEKGRRAAQPRGTRRAAALRRTHRRQRH